MMLRMMPWIMLVILASHTMHAMDNYYEAIPRLREYNCDRRPSLCRGVCSGFFGSLLGIGLGVGYAQHAHYADETVASIGIGAGVGGFLTFGLLGYLLGHSVVTSVKRCLCEYDDIPSDDEEERPLVE